MTTLALLLSLSLSAAPPQSPQASQQIGRREIGAIVTDGIPEIPQRIVDRTNQYNNIRFTSFQDWSPDGKGMLIGTRFAETTQLHQVGAPGAFREQLTFFPEPVSGGAFDPKTGPKKGFLFAMDTGGNEFYQFYWFDRESGKHQLLTDGKSRNESLRVSNAGGRYAFTSTLRNGKDFDVYLLEGPDPKSAKRVKELEGKWNIFDWSPDDSQLLLQRYVSINESYLYTLHLGTGELTEINPNPTRGAKKIAYGAGVFAKKGGGIYYSSDEDSEVRRLVHYQPNKKTKDLLMPSLAWDVTQIAVSRDGKTIAFTANEAGTSVLYLGPTAQPLRARPIELPKGVIFNIEFDHKSQRLGFYMSGGNAASDAYSFELASRKLVRWTFSELGGLNPATFVQPTLIEYPSFDGKKISAWLYRPRGSGPDRPVPVIVSIHGGPEAQAMAWFNRDAQYWVNELGAAVILPNVRGSSGYGKTFLTLDDAERREDSVKDIGHLLDWIGRQPDLDKNRVAVTGGSYGGYMVLASMIQFGDRLRCGIDIVGISNFVTFLENTEAYRRDLRRVEYGDERDPKMRQLLQSISPLTSAGKIRKPLFVAQGQNDPRVPASEAEQIVAAVRKAGGAVWYLLAKDEGHGFQKKKNRDFLQNATTLFLEEHLLR